MSIKKLPVYMGAQFFGAFLAAGCGSAAFPDSHYGFLTVYVFSPITVGILSSLIFTKLIKPLMNKREKKPNSDCH
jgi:glycerol uptake facilitator-like aquaporin